MSLWQQRYDYDYDYYNNIIRIDKANATRQLDYDPLHRLTSEQIDTADT